MAIIPQEPVLFAGTLRSNVDPFGLLPDAVVNTALTEAGVPIGLSKEADTVAAEGDRSSLALTTRVSCHKPPPAHPPAHPA